MGSPGFWACKLHVSWDSLFICFPLIGCVVTVEDIGDWIFVDALLVDYWKWLIISPMEGTCCYQFLPLTTARFLFMPIRTVASATTLPPPMQSVLGTFPDGLGAIFSIYILYFDFFYLSTDGVILRCHLCSNCQIYKISLVASKNFNCCVKSVDISALKSVIFVFPVGTHN